MKRITSARNEQLKYLSKLVSQSKARRAHGQTVLEGVHLLQAFLQAGGQPVQVYVPEGKQDSDEVRRLLVHLPESALTFAAPGVLSKTGGLAGAEELMALIDIPEPLSLPRSGDCVVLERVQDPGNTGTVMRSAAAAGVGQLVLGAGCADAWSPKVLRAGMGAHFLLDIFEGVNLPQWCKGYQGRVLAAALSGACSLYGMPLAEPAAWVFGNEGSGVSAGLLEQAHARVKIPMAGQTESLNVAMAATVCLFEQMRQRHHNA